MSPIQTQLRRAICSITLWQQANEENNSDLPHSLHENKHFKKGKEYFKDLAKKKNDFMWVDEKDGDAIELAFSKKKIEERKNWLWQFQPATYLDQKEKLIK